MYYLDHSYEFVGALSATLAAAPAPSSAQGLVATVWELTWKGGIVMIPIAIASLVAVAFAIERTIVLRRARVLPPGLLDSMRGALPHDPERAMALARQSASPLGRIAAAGLALWSRSPADIEKRLVEVGLRENATLRGRLKVLAFVVGVSPMLGLLGTIFGMITAFRTVAASPDALGRTELLAGGIYEALVTTAAGLLVAIPVLLIHSLLAGMADRRLGELDSACHAILDQHDRVERNAPEQVARVVEIRPTTAAAESPAEVAIA
jgi:biopolymer transport protein ExbB